jgi:general secretion pathway protein D
MWIDNKNMRLDRRLWLLALLVMPGCQPAPSPAGAGPSAAGAPAAVVVEQQPAALPYSGRVDGQISPGAALARPSAAYSAAPALNVGSSAAPSTTGDISLDFAGTDIHTVVDQILGGILHANYTIDPSVSGTATLHTVNPIARENLLPTLQTLLAQNHAVLMQQDGLYRVMPADEAAISPGLAAGEGLGGGALIALRYADASQLATVLQPYVATGGKIVAAPDENAIIVSGDPATRAALTGLIEAFDVDELAGQSYELFPVTSGDAKDFATAFSTALGISSSGDQSQAGAAPGPISVVPLERINAVLVIAKTQSFLFDAQRVYAVINQVERETVRGWHVYYLQNGRANDAAYVLQQAFTPDDVTAQPTPVATGQAVSGLEDQNNSSGSGGGSVGGITGLGGSSGIGGVIGSSVTNAPSSTSTGSTTTTAASSSDNSGGASALLGPLSQTAGGQTTDAIRIIPDLQNNSLLIYGTAEEDDKINAMLSKIDISPVEVRIDATIAEVDLDNALQYGTQFFFKSGDINAVLSTGTSAALNTSFPGFVLSGAGSDAAPLAISALQSVTKVNILSSPELMVLDGQAASLQVGDLVPYLSQTSQSTITSTSEVVNSIDYRETGVILQVTPHVGANGLVTLDVAQEVSGVASGVTTAGINSPTFTERAVTSRVAIADGQTIGLAGLISDNDSHANSGIPFLKNIPLLGDLVSNQNNSRTREELLVLITPHVIRTQNDADALTADLREELPNAANVEPALQFNPPGGSPDPDANLRARIPANYGD